MKNSKSMSRPTHEPPPVNRYDYEAINSVVDGVLEITRQYEDKWGVGRLVLLVPDELRERFRLQLTRFDDAVSKHDVIKVRLAGAAMRRAWEALDQTTEESGAKKLNPEVWEIALPDGRVIGFCRHIHNSFDEFRSGRHLEVWTVEEIARLIQNFPEIALSKETFPGAYVTSAKPKPVPEVPGTPDNDVIYEEEEEEAV